MKRWMDGHMADVETGGRVTKKAGTLYSVLKGALECRFFCDPHLTGLDSICTLVPVMLAALTHVQHRAR